MTIENKARQGGLQRGGGGVDYITGGAEERAPEQVYEVYDKILQDLK